MAKSLFLYEEPFVVKNSYSAKTQYLSETLRLTDFERGDELELRNLILKFIIDNKLVINEDNVIRQSVEKNIGTWEWLLNWRSFRSLVDRREYSNALHVLQVGGADPLEKILDLHVRIGTMFDARFLNTICDRVMQAIQIIPYEVDDSEYLTTWEEIHEETPFIWLLIMIQSIIRSEAKE